MTIAETDDAEGERFVGNHDGGGAVGAPKEFAQYAVIAFAFDGIPRWINRAIGRLAQIEFLELLLDCLAIFVVERFVPTLVEHHGYVAVA